MKNSRVVWILENTLDFLFAKNTQEGIGSKEKFTQVRVRTLRKLAGLQFRIMAAS